ncbi:MAG: DUF2798 domain-containing protein [Pseudomonadota bacterium]
MPRKIAYRYRTVLFALLMSCCTALIVSGTIIYLHSESQVSFMVLWLGAFMTAWPIVFVAILLIAPVVNKLVGLMVEDITGG